MKRSRLPKKHKKKHMCMWKRMEEIDIEAHRDT